MNNNDKDIDFDPDYLNWKEQDLLNSIEFYEAMLCTLAEKTAKYQKELQECRVMLSKVRWQQQQRDKSNKTTNQ